MINYEDAIYNVNVPDDSKYPTTALEPNIGGGSGSKLVRLADVCL